MFDIYVPNTVSVTITVVIMIKNIIVKDFDDIVTPLLHTSGVVFVLAYQTLTVS